MDLDETQPDRMLSESDKGDEIQKRFRYQNEFSASLAIQMLFHETDIDEIFCEQHEDVLVRKKDGTFIGYQVKTRDENLGLFTFNTPAIQSSLEKFVRTEKEFGEWFNRYVIASNCGFSSKEKLCEYIVLS